MTRFIYSLVLFSLLAGCAHNMHKSTQTATSHEQAMMNMSPDQMMAKITEAGTPGAEHLALQPLVGKWKTESKWWAAPGTTPDVQHGTANHQWVQGKRFVKEDYSGKFAGKSFNGMGLLGYDKTKGEYVSIWTDTMGTGIMNSSGKYDPSTKSIEMTSTYSCPITGGERKSKAVTRILDNNTHVFEMYDQTPEGAEFKSLEIKYKRQA